jgi:hypothetical protein
LAIASPASVCTHNGLFSSLGAEDIVISFNYDELADYELWESGRLGAASFDRLGFQSMNFPFRSQQPLKDPIRFIKIHGSVNWSADYHERSEPMPIHYCLRPYEATKPQKGTTPHPVILPFHYKEEIYTSHPVYKLHTLAFFEAIGQATELYLVGKNFMNADQELNRLIRLIRNPHLQRLVLINPAADDPTYVSFHRYFRDSLRYLVAITQRVHDD